ncbi:hypothetical protein PTKIN_Ptkin06aG0109500 [Pterospermum kingtungense]
MNRNQMRLRRGLACLALLLLMLLQFETQCYAGVHDKLNRFKSGSVSRLSPSFKSRGRSKGSNTAKAGADDIFCAEQRKVYTGPNPLHNR